MMKRDLSLLSKQTYELLVVGGGITGAAIAWDAAQRGLRVALLEKADFGGATSANSLKTLHGGLRYLQDLDLGLVRKMIGERKALLQIAPHLVRPLPVLMPTIKSKLMRSKLALGAAVKLNDLASFDRNWGVDPARALPNGRILSRRAVQEIMPGLNDPAVTGGVLWHDAQMVNTERLTLAFVQSAVQAGAQAANYTAVIDLLRQGNHVTGVKALDILSGQTHEIHAQVVVNAAGPWIDEVLAPLGVQRTQPVFPLSTAMNLVTRQILPHHAVGVSSRYQHPLPDGRSEPRTRVLFIAPWREFSIVGTLHAPYQGTPDDNWVQEQMIASFLEEVNGAYPGARLQRQDVYQVHRGFLPMVPNDADPATVKLLRAGEVRDHAIEDGIHGLISAVGVKYTTGRYLAEKTVNRAFEKLQRPSPRCLTRSTPLVGGDVTQWQSFVQQMLRSWPVEAPPYQVERLLSQYGTAVHQLLPLIAEQPAWGEPLTAETAVTPAELIHAARTEMAERLTDVVMRRTEMGSAGPPNADTIHAAAHIMADAKGWDAAQMRQEIDAVWAAYDIQQNV